MSKCEEQEKEKEKKNDTLRIKWGMLLLKNIYIKWSEGKKKMSPTNST